MPTRGLSRRIRPRDPGPHQTNFRAFVRMRTARRPWTSRCGALGSETTRLRLAMAHDPSGASPRTTTATSSTALLRRRRAGGPQLAAHPRQGEGYRRAYDGGRWGFDPVRIVGLGRFADRAPRARPRHRSATASSRGRSSASDQLPRGFRDAAHSRPWTSRCGAPGSETTRSTSPTTMTSGASPRTTTATSSRCCSSKARRRASTGGSSSGKREGYRRAYDGFDPVPHRGLGRFADRAPRARPRHRPQPPQDPGRAWLPGRKCRTALRQSDLWTIRRRNLRLRLRPHQRPGHARYPRGRRVRRSRALLLGLRGRDPDGTRVNRWRSVDEPSCPRRRPSPTG